MYLDGQQQFAMKPIEPDNENRYVACAGLRQMWTWLMQASIAQLMTSAKYSLTQVIWSAASRVDGYDRGTPERVYIERRVDSMAA